MYKCKPIRYIIIYTHHIKFVKKNYLNKYKYTYSN